MFSLIEVSTAPGSSHEKVIKVLESRKAAIEWIEGRGYKKNENINVWENKKDEDYFVWIYVKIIGIS